MRTIQQRLTERLTKSITKYATDGQWITIGGDAERDKKHAGGTPVQIDGSGNIQKGPDSLLGANLDQLDKNKAGTSKDKRKKNTPPNNRSKVNKAFGGTEREATDTKADSGAIEKARQQAQEYLSKKGVPQDQKSEREMLRKLKQIADKNGYSANELYQEFIGSPDGMARDIENELESRPARKTKAPEQKQFKGKLDTEKKIKNAYQSGKIDARQAKQAIDEIRSKSVEPSKNTGLAAQIQRQAKEFSEKWGGLKKSPNGSDIRRGLNQIRDMIKEQGIDVENAVQNLKAISSDQEYQDWFDGQTEGIKNPADKLLTAINSAEQEMRNGQLISTGGASASSYVPDDIKKQINKTLRGAIESKSKPKPKPKPKPKARPKHRAKSELDKQIVDTFGSNDKELVTAFKQTMKDAHAMLSEPINEHNDMLKQALSSYVGTRPPSQEQLARLKKANPKLSQHQIREKAQDESKRKGIAGFVSALRRTKGDYSKLKGFDELADHVMREYPALLGASAGESESGMDAENQLFKVIQKGPLPQIPKLGEEVFSKTVEMMGGWDALESMGEEVKSGNYPRTTDVSFNDDDEDAIPFAARLHREIERVIYNSPARTRGKFVNEYTRQRFEKAKGEFEWITIGGGVEGDKKHVGGTPVQIDGSGNIVKGPSELQGANLDQLDKNKAGTKKDKRKTNTPPKPKQQGKTDKAKAKQLFEKIKGPLIESTAQKHGHDPKEVEKTLLQLIESDPKRATKIFEMFSEVHAPDTKATAKNPFKKNTLASEARPEEVVRPEEVEKEMESKTGVFSTDHGHTLTASKEQIAEQAKLLKGLRGISHEKVEKQWQEKQTDIKSKIASKIAESRSAHAVGKRIQAKDIEGSRKYFKKQHQLDNEATELVKELQEQHAFYEASKLRSKSKPKLTIADIANNEFDPEKHGGYQPLLKIADQISNGEMSLEEMKETHELFSANAEAFRADLQKRFSAAKLKNISGNMGNWHAKSNTKAENAKHIHETLMRNAFDISGGNMDSYDMEELRDPEHRSKRLRSNIDKFTQDDLDKHIESNRERNEARKAKAEAEKKALENPETIEDFRKHEYMDLTPEQREKYDTLVADQTREEMQATEEKKAQVSQFKGEGGGLDFDLSTNYHSKRDQDIYTASPKVRVDRDSYNELNSAAKKLGGWYYKPYKGTPGGFHFPNEDARNKFLSLQSGDVDNSDAAKEKKKLAAMKTHERLNAHADRIEERANKALNADRQTNTARRAGMAAAAEGQARKEIAHAKTMRAISEAVQNGQAKFLEGITQSTHIEELHTLTKRAAEKAYKESLIQKHGSIKNAPFSEQQKLVDREFSADQSAADYAEYPYPKLWAEEVETVARNLKGKRGVSHVRTALERLANKARAATRAQHAQTIEENEGADIREFANGRSNVAETLKKQMLDKRVKDHGDDGLVKFGKNDWDTFSDALSKMKKSGAINKSDGNISRLIERMEGAQASQKRLQAAGIHNEHQLRAALRQFIPLTSGTQAEDPVKKAERALIGKKHAGFFPTPTGVIDQMLAHAGIEKGHRVLEPSAGKGDIVDAIKRDHPESNVKALEMNRAFQDVMSAKGHEVEYGDFTEHKGEYDRILMNPPFEKGQDMAHVKHAYEQLAEGGRLVSIMASGGGAKREEFDKWVESIGGEIHELPSGSFAGNDSFRQTGVSTKMVVIPKQSTEKFSILISNEFARQRYKHAKREFETAFA